VDALVARGADLFAQNNQGETPLLKTVRQGNVNAVQCLIAKVLSVANAAQLASTASNKGYTPVHEAAIWGRADLMKLLLDSKLFDVNAQDKEGNTPLHLAGDRKLGAMLLNEDPLGKVRVLLEHGALTNIKNAQVRTIFSYRLSVWNCTDAPIRETQ
jgi:ankyrin repeat protein